VSWAYEEITTDSINALNGPIDAASAELVDMALKVRNVVKRAN
jgi:hypothetical protein